MIVYFLKVLKFMKQRNSHPTAEKKEINRWGDFVNE